MECCVEVSGGGDISKKSLYFADIACIMAACQLAGGTPGAFP